MCILDERSEYARPPPRMLGRSQPAMAPKRMQSAGVAVVAAQKHTPKPGVGGRRRARQSSLVMREQEAEHLQQIAEAELELDKQQRQQRMLSGGGEEGKDVVEADEASLHKLWRFVRGSEPDGGDRRPPPEFVLVITPGLPLRHCQ